MERNKQYPIMKIARLRIGSDGEGIRTLVLVGNCLLKCRYCINAFTWNGSVIPSYLTVETLYEKICIDRPYILASSGGITFGGGEPLLYPDLINEVRKICEPEMSIYVENSLHVKWENIALVADQVGRFYVDIKSMDPSIYQEYTSQDLKLTKHNLINLLKIKGPEEIVVRIPEIPGYVSQESQEESMQKLKELGITHFDLFKYKIPES